MVATKKPTAQTILFGYFNAPLAKRYEVIKNLCTEYNVHTLCEALKVAKGSYYNHLLRNKNENTKANQKQSEMKPIIEQIFHENNQIFGSSKIHAILMESFFGSFKREGLYRYQFKIEREFFEAIDTYITFYNGRRPYSILMNQTPDKFEEAYLSRHKGKTETETEQT